MTDTSHPTLSVSGDSPRRVADLNVAKSDLRVLLRVLRDSRTQWYVPVLMLGVVVWGLSPIDALPDVFPVLGVLDDVIVFALCRAAVYRVVPDEYVEEHATAVAQDGSRRFTLRHFVGGIVIFQLSVLLVAMLAVGHVVTGLL